jgi:bifunctional DNA-binding transcriptional regulator/antitoxin component of YhaV-PrlF toxin-antitoxin module
MSTKVLTAKKIKVSSKGQIIFTVPKKYLEEIGATTGDELTVNFLKNKIEIHNQRQVFKDKIKNFKPISLGKGIITNIAATHNDVYDQ